ncbi:MAG: sugar phosphate isomerase/epimerase family protein [Desulfocapsaceae bacterium]
MSKQYSLAYLTVSGCSPSEMIHIAARTGYDFVGLRLIPMGIPGEYPFRPDDKEQISKIEVAFKETGVGLLDLELARIVEDVDPLSYLPAMEVAAQWGARHVISSAWTASRGNRNFVIDRYAEICDLAKPFGLTVSLEFPSFSRLATLQEAAEIVRAADRSNGGILVDTLYYHFSKVSLEELEELPNEWIHLLHVCDAPTEIPDRQDEMVHVARDERLYVGEGCIDFSSILQRLPHVPISIELPHAAMVKKYGYEGHARRCLETAKLQLDQIPTKLPRMVC